MAVKAIEALDVQDMDTYEYYVDRINELIKQFNGEEEMPARCGINTDLVPQQGRWFLATVGIKL